MKKSIMLACVVSLLASAHGASAGMEAADVLGLSVKVQDVATDGYAWYDLGVFRPADTQIFWIGPGHFGEDGKSNIRGLWVDRIELGVVGD